MTALEAKYVNAEQNGVYCMNSSGWMPVCECFNESETHCTDLLHDVVCHNEDELGA
jgi:hypothetical protein